VTASVQERTGEGFTVTLLHRHGSLAVRLADDGRGFDPARTSTSAGLQSIRDPLDDLGGTFRVASSPGHGTDRSISLAWAAAVDGQR
jgi:signal transduction histidine kinase